MTKNLKKYLILGFLFFFPIFVYVFLSTGINNFAKLPVLTQTVMDIENIEGNSANVSFKNTHLLQITGAMPSDSGRYICTASDGVTVITDTVELRVTGKKEFAVTIFVHLMIFRCQYQILKYILPFYQKPKLMEEYRQE